MKLEDYAVNELSLDAHGEWTREIIELMKTHLGTVPENVSIFHMVQRSELGQESVYHVNDELLMSLDEDEWLKEQYPGAHEGLHEMLAGVHIFSDDDHLEIIMVALREKGLLSWNNDRIAIRVWW